MTRRALLMGLNYPNTQNELRGCVNDIKRMRGLLLNNRFAEKNITIVSDDYPGAIFSSKANILNQIRTFAQSIKPGDTGLLHYSGHGTWTRDYNKDEADGRDEAICPTTGGNIYDDEIRKILVENLAIGGKLLAVMDCCYSASSFDMENNLDRRENIKPVNQQHGYVVAISGCQDNQTSADALIEQRYQGAMTASLFERVEQIGLNGVLDICFSNVKARMKSFRDQMYDWLREHDFVQKPNISYEGRLPQPVVVGFKSGKYNLRQVASRNPADYTVQNEVPTMDFTSREVRKLHM